MPNLVGLSVVLLSGRLVVLCVLYLSVVVQIVPPLLAMLVVAEC